MFVIVPSSRGSAAHVGPGESVRGPTRTQNACQECKVRKAKCDGFQPCARCRARDLVCVYSKADAGKLGLPVTPERGVMLQQQNDRLIRALRSMAARIAVLQSSGGHSTGGKHQDADTVAESPEGASRANIADILDRFAPQSTYAADMQESYHDRPQSKKRRVDNDCGEPASEKEGSPYMIMPSSQLQTQQISGSNPATSVMQIAAENNHGNGTNIAAPDNLDTPDPHLQAYQTLLQMSQAHKSRATEPRGQTGMGAGTLDLANVPIAMPASLEESGQASSQNLLPNTLNYGPTALDGGFPDSLLDLVDWDASLENCAPVSWDWNQDGQ